MTTRRHDLSLALRFATLAIALIANTPGIATAANAPPPATFLRAYNLNGPPVEIDGRHWEGRDAKSYDTRDNAFDNQSVPLVPPTDPVRAQMIRSSRWSGNVSIRFTDIDPGNCQVAVYVWEDNSPETFTVGLQDQVVAKDLRSGAAGEWRRLGPFPVQVGDDRTITLTARGGAANISGVEIWRGLGPIPELGEPQVIELPPISAEAATHFRTQIAPLLAQHCLECHNSSEPRGNLDLSQWPNALEGGESGASIVPGKPDDSLLWEYVRTDEMPAKRPPLSAAEKSTLHDWIASGAPWADRKIDPFQFSTDTRAGYDWWSLQPVQRPDLPTTTQPRWGRNEIDRFILASLEATGLAPADEADRRTLIRRVSFDLTGLPPTPADVDAFVHDADPQAYERLVDRLLESPHFGERWARHWLDVIRFGETQGFERNRIRENAWRYRDWVIDAFNRNLPYDEFVRQQIAGDVLHPDDLGPLIATGYHVCGTWDMVGFLEGSREMQKANRQDHLEDLVGTLGQAFLGLTLNCARCHDHKFDPILQQDYYRIAAVLDGVQQRDPERAEIKRAPHADRLAERGFAGVAHVPYFQQPPTTFVLARGNYRDPRDPVAPAGISALEHAGLPGDLGLSLDAPEAERRRKLADWLTDPRNPLTARVMVNRLWYYHFGQGLVDTPSDFGFSGGRPSHPELLDWLADEFVHSGWNLRHLHKLILLSSTYRQRSRVDNAQADRIDADNRLYWRANRRRLEGEAIRDAVLFTSGALNPQLGGPSFHDVTATRNEKSKNDEFTTPTNDFTDDTCRRSIYRLWARSGGHPLMDALDCPDPTVAVPRRAQTITPLQALSLLNNPFTEHCARRAAARIQAEITTDDRPGQVNRAFQLTLQRLPTERELGLIIPFAREYGLEQVCLTLFNGNEFLYVD